MRPLVAVVCLCLGLMAAGCSRSDSGQLKHDAQAVGHDVASDVRKVGDDPDLKAAGDQLKDAAHDTGTEAKKAGQDIRDHTHEAADDTRDAANR